MLAANRICNSLQLDCRDCQPKHWCITIQLLESSLLVCMLSNDRIHNVCSSFTATNALFCLISTSNRAMQTRHMFDNEYFRIHSTCTTLGQQSKIRYHTERFTVELFIDRHVLEREHDLSYLQFKMTHLVCLQKIWSNRVNRRLIHRRNSSFYLRRRSNWWQNEIHGKQKHCLSICSVCIIRIDLDKYGFSYHE
jgi:hypothetical protein